MRRRSSKGFSLLELVLAIGLSVVVIVMIGLAIDQHSYRLEAGRESIERAQLARVVLDHIAADLRATTSAPTQDVSEQMQYAEEAALFNVDEVDKASASEEDDSDSEDTIEEDRPGIRGIQTDILIDRRYIGQTITDQSPAGDGLPVAEINPGWVQVRYFLVTGGQSPGLYRTEQARDEALWAEEQGQSPVPDDAWVDEVASFGLSYFDGQQSYGEWDPNERGGLPNAVEVSIQFYAASSTVTSGLPAVEQRVYRRLVLIPAAMEENSADDATEGDDAESEVL